MKRAAFAFILLCAIALVFLPARSFAQDGSQLTVPSLVPASPSPSPISNTVLSGLFTNAQSAIAAPCGGQNNVVGAYIDSLYNIFTFQTTIGGIPTTTGPISTIRNHAVSIAMDLFSVAFGIGLLQLGRQLMKADLNTAIFAMTSRIITLILGIMAINVAGGWYLLPNGGGVAEAQPFTSQALSAGANFANTLFGGLLQTASASANGANPILITPPTTPGMEVSYSTCVAAKLVSYAFVSGFASPGATAAQNAGAATQATGFTGWLLGSTLDLVVGMLLAIVYVLMVFPSALAVLISGVLMANHFFVLGVNANLLGVAAIFTLGFMGHEATRPWGKPFIALCFSIFTTSLVLQFVNIVISAGATIIDAQLRSTSWNIQDVAFRSLAMSAITLALAIRGPKLAGIFMGAMGFDTADAIEGLAATAGLAAMTAKMAMAGLKAARGGIAKLAGGASAERSVGGAGADGKSGDNATPSSDPSAGRGTPTAGKAQPTPAAAKGAPSPSAARSMAEGLGAAGANVAARAAQAGQTLRKRAASAGSAASDATAKGADAAEGNATAGALTNFANNLESQAESAQAAGQPRDAARAGALADAAKELASHADDVEPGALQETTESLASAAEQITMAAPTDALQHTAATLSQSASPEAKAAGMKLAGIAAMADGAYNAGSALASTMKATANGGQTTGTAVGRSINNARDVAQSKGNDTTTAGKAAAGVAKTLGALDRATGINATGAAAIGIVGATLSSAINAHATTQGSATMFNAASTQFATAAADPTLDAPTRSAFLEASAAAGEAAASVATSPPSQRTTAPLGMGPAATPIAQSLAAETNDAMALAHSTAAGAVWQHTAGIEARNGSTARAEAATRVSAAMTAMGRVGAPRNDLERQAYALVATANEYLENGHASPGEVAGILANSETLMRASAQQLDPGNVRSLHLNTAARALGSSSIAVGALMATETAAARDSVPTPSTPTNFPGPPPPPTSDPPNQQRPRATASNGLGRGLTATFYRVMQHHSRTNHITPPPPQF